MPVHAQHAVQRSAAAVLDRVAEALRRRRLADDARVDRLAARLQRRDDRRRAVDGVALFVRRQQHRDRAAVHRLARDDALGRRDHRGDRRLHVRGAAAVQKAVALGRRERIARPLARPDPVGTTSTWPARQTSGRRRSVTRPQVAHRAAIDPLARESPPPTDATPAAPGCRHRRA